MAPARRRGGLRPSKLNRVHWDGGGGGRAGRGWLQARRVVRGPADGAGGVEVSEEDEVGVAMEQVTGEICQQGPLFAAQRITVALGLEVHDHHVEVGAAMDAQVGRDGGAHVAVKGELGVLTDGGEELEGGGVERDPQALVAAAAVLGQVELPAGEELGEGGGVVDLLDREQVGAQVVQALAQAREVLIGAGEVVQVPRDDAGAIPFKSRGRRA